MAGTEERLLLRTRPADGVEVLTLNRPAKKNALSIALRDQISDALDAIAADEDVRCAVVTGEGDTFCAGFDLTEFDNPDPSHHEKLWASSDRYHNTLLAFPLPLVAAVNGSAIAGGFDLAVCCDIRVAAQTARFAHPERLFGQVVYAPLHDLVGASVASDLVLTGRVLHAVEAEVTGLVREVVAPEDTLAAGVRVAATVAEAPRDLLVQTKAKIIARRGIDLDGATLAL